MLKGNLLDLFVSIQKAELPLFHLNLNFGSSVMIPEKDNAIQIHQKFHMCGTVWKIEQNNF
jgi:hypothetical protein